MNRSPLVSRLISLGLGLVCALQCWNAWAATIHVEIIYRDALLNIRSGSGHTIEEAEADLRSQMEAYAKSSGDLVVSAKELARCTGGGYSAYAQYISGVGGFGGTTLVVCGFPSWESALVAAKAKCMRESANFDRRVPHHEQCPPFPMENDHFQTKESWFFGNKKPEQKPESKPMETIGTRSYDGRYAPDCTKIGLSLDIHGDTMTLSENGRVLFTQKGKLHYDYWGRTPPPGGEAGFAGETNAGSRFEIMRQGGVLFGNINPSKQLEGLMAGRPLKVYRFCGPTCNAGKAEVSGGNLVCRR